jgi:acetyl-CoA carboxylase carboxyltransferase component
MTEFRSPLQAQIVQWFVAPGDTVRTGDVLVILEAMKMEHEVRATDDGRVTELLFAAGDTVNEGELLLISERVTTDSRWDGAEKIQNSGREDVPGHPPSDAAPAALRADLQRVVDRHAFTFDASRPEAVAKRHALGQRTARENIADLCDEGSFIEYGALAVAAQRSRRSEDDLMRNTPADGMVTGIGSINSLIHGPEASRTVVMAYDATVLAGTQGMRNHAKTDRMLGIALDQKLPVVLFAEGGGGRPGDTDMPIVAGLHVSTFASYARLSGQVPVIGIVSGRCFAGNAALLGCSDVIIATRSSNIGMGGPAMVEGGGLGVFKPEQIGPGSVQHRNGVIDILVEDEARAVAAARHYLSFFQGRTRDWITPDPLALRTVVPENRLRVYDTRAAMAGIVDAGSLLELRTGFGIGIHTALARIEGRPVGLMANNPLHLGGAIDADAADKAARFMQLCNAHGLPLVSLVDTPGFMVGPDIEEKAQVRHVSRLFVTAASLRVPYFSIVLRKGYGLGAMGMTAGGFHAPVFNVAWPTGEFGAMGLEGAVRLGYRKELEAVPEGPQRQALYDKLVAQQYANGSALNMAATLEIDAVIDPADTRVWLARGLASSRVRERTETPMPGLLPHVDPDGLLEYSVVYTDRALNHMSKSFQGVMKDISRRAQEVYNARIAPSSCRAAAPSAWRRWRASSPATRRCWSSATAGSATAGRRSSTWAASRREQIVLKARRRARGRRSRSRRRRSPRWSPPSARHKPAVVFAPHVETSAGMSCPMTICAKSPLPCARSMACSCSTASPPARCGSTWAPGVDVLVSAPQKGWSSSPCAPGHAGRARTGAHRLDHQHQLRLRPEEVAADHGNLRRRRPRLPRDHADRRADPPARRDARNRSLRFRQGEGQRRSNWAAGACAARSRGFPSVARRGLPGALRGGQLHGRSGYPERQEIHGPGPADRRRRAAAGATNRRTSAASASACSASTSCRTSSAPWGTRTMKGEAYLKHWATANVYFHVTTAYAILRHNGVKLGKVDFLLGNQAPV